MSTGFRHYINPDELDVLRRFADGAKDITAADRSVLVSFVRRLDGDVSEQSSDLLRHVRTLEQEANTDDRQVDDDAWVLQTEAGFWVSAWVWVANDAAT